MEIKISRYLSYIEATKSEAAIRRGIDNTPNLEQLEAMRYVAENVFDVIREWIRGPLHASSFFRSQTLNALIGGSKNSQHCKGEAIDIDCDKYGFGRNQKVFEFVRDNMQFDQLISEFPDQTGNPSWVHVSLVNPLKRRNRKDILIAKRDSDGHTVYFRT